MENKQSYNLNDVLAKLKCITDFFSNKTGSGWNCMTRRWISMLLAGICVATVGAAAFTEYRCAQAAEVAA